MRLALFIAFLLIACPVAAFAQCPVMPQGFVCISQATVNQAAENKRELDATKDAYAVAKAQLIEKDKIIQDNKADAEKSINELKAANTKVLVDLGTATGQVIQANAEIVRLTASFQFLLEHGRVKQNGIINVKF